MSNHFWINILRLDGTQSRFLRKGPPPPSLRLVDGVGSYRVFLKELDRLNEAAFYVESGTDAGVRSLEEPRP